MSPCMSWVRPGSRSSEMLYLILIFLSQSRALQLQNVNKNPGLLPVKLGQAYRQEDKWTILKVLDLSNIQNVLTFNSQKYLEFDKIINGNNYLASEFYNTRLQARNVHDVTMEKIKQLVPTSRVKRGLLNPLGSFIKVITGNLDHNDAIRYDKLISKVQGNQIQTENKLTIISEMLDIMLNSTYTLHSNTLILDERLSHLEQIISNIVSEENNSSYGLSISNMFNLFITNFNMIYFTLSEIETALAFSKVSVLHQSIINSTELVQMLQKIAKYDNLPYTVNLRNLVSLERIMVVKAYVKENQITFILEMPITNGNIYNYFKMYSLPTYNSLTNLTKVIIPKYPYLLVKGSEYSPVAKHCEEIAAQQFLCGINDVVPYPDLTCAEQLMKFEPDLTLCTPHIVEVEDIKVQRVSSSSWIIYTRASSILMEKCGDDVTRKLIQGTYLLTIDEGCQIYLNDLKLDYRRSSAADLRYQIFPITSLPEVKEMSIKETAKINIKGINLDHLNQLTNIAKSWTIKNENSVSASENEIVHLHSVSLATILLYIIIVLSLISFLVWKFKVFHHMRNHHDSKSSDDFTLEEGGVMQRQPLKRVTINK